MKATKQIHFKSSTGNGITVDKGCNGFYVSLEKYLGLGCATVPYTLISMKAFDECDYDFFEDAFEMLMEV